MAEEDQDRSKQARAVVRYLRVSPRKVRLVTRLLARKPVAVAFSTLGALNKKGARLVERGLKSAVSNAKVKGLDPSRLVVSEIKADGGPTIKRFMSRAMGRADSILKRTTHLTIVLQEGEKVYGPLLPGKQAKGGKEKAKKEKAPQAKAAAGAGGA